MSAAAWRFRLLWLDDGVTSKKGDPLTPWYYTIDSEEEAVKVESCGHEVQRLYLAPKGDGE